MNPASRSHSEKVPTEPVSTKRSDSVKLKRKDYKGTSHKRKGSTRTKGSPLTQTFISLTDLLPNPQNSTSRHSTVDHFPFLSFPQGTERRSFKNLTLEDTDKLFLENSPTGTWFVRSSKKDPQSFTRVTQGPEGTKTKKVTLVTKPKKKKIVCLNNNNQELNKGNPLTLTLDRVSELLIIFNSKRDVETQQANKELLASITEFPGYHANTETAISSLKLHPTGTFCVTPGTGDNSFLLHYKTINDVKSLEFHIQNGTITTSEKLTFFFFNDTSINFQPFKSSTSVLLDPSSDETATLPYFHAKSFLFYLRNRCLIGNWYAADMSLHTSQVSFTPLNKGEETVKSFPGFHGSISSTEAAILLHNKKPGTFLIRNSSTPNQYAFSYVCGGEIAHFKFHYAGSSIVSSGETFSSFLGKSVLRDSETETTEAYIDYASTCVTFHDGYSFIDYLIQTNCVSVYYFPKIQLFWKLDSNITVRHAKNSPIYSKALHTLSAMALSERLYLQVRLIHRLGHIFCQPTAQQLQESQYHMVVSGETPVKLPKEVAFKVLSLNPRGERVKENETGNHYVSFIEGLVFKQDGLPPLRTTYELATSIFFQLGTPARLEIVTPSVSFALEGNNNSLRIQTSLDVGYPSYRGHKTHVDFEDLISASYLVSIIRDAYFDEGGQEFRSHWNRWINVYQQTLAGYRMSSSELANIIINLIFKTGAPKPKEFTGSNEEWITDFSILSYDQTKERLQAIIEQDPARWLLTTSIITSIPSVMEGRSLFELLNFARAIQTVYELIAKPHPYKEPLHTKELISRAVALSSKIDFPSMASLALNSLLTLPSDGKGDNLMFKIEWSGGDIVHLWPYSIDNDDSFSPQTVEHLSEGVTKQHLNHRSIVYALLVLFYSKKSIPPEVLEPFQQPEVFITQWICSTLAFNDSGEQLLVPPGFLTSLYQKLLFLKNKLEPSTTLLDLFQLFDPLTSLCFSTLNNESKNPLKVMWTLYRGPCIRTILREYDFDRPLLKHYNGKAESINEALSESSLEQTSPVEKELHSFLGTVEWDKLPLKDKGEIYGALGKLPFCVHIPLDKRLFHYGIQQRDESIVTFFSKQPSTQLETLLLVINTYPNDEATVTACMPSYAIGNEDSLCKILEALPNNEIGSSAIRTLASRGWPMNVLVDPHGYPLDHVVALNKYRLAETLFSCGAYAAKHPEKVLANVDIDFSKLPLMGVVWTGFLRQIYSGDYENKVFSLTLKRSASIPNPEGTKNLDYLNSLDAGSNFTVIGRKINVITIRAGRLLHLFAMSLFHHAIHPFLTRSIEVASVKNGLGKSIVAVIFPDQDAESASIECIPELQLIETQASTLSTMLISPNGTSIIDFNFLKTISNLYQVNSKHIRINGFLDGNRQQIKKPNVLFFLKEMDIPLHPNVAKHFLNKSPLEFLNDWLSQLAKLQETCEEAFVETFAIGKSTSEIDTDFSFFPSHLARTLWRFKKLQFFISSHSNPTPREILGEILPSLEKLYANKKLDKKILFDSFKSELPEEHYVDAVAHQTFEVTSADTLPLAKMQAHLPLLSTLMDKILTGRSTFLETYGITKECLLSPSYTGLLLTSIDYRQLDKPGRAKYIDYLLNHNVHLTALNLSDSEVTDEVLIKLLAISPELEHIDILNCNNLSVKAFSQLQGLTQLTTLKCSPPKGVSALAFDSLKQLELKNSPLRKIHIDAPLTKVRVQNCPQLKTVKLSSNAYVETDNHDAKYSLKK